MTLKKIDTENYEGVAAKVGELTIADEVLSVYEIAIKENFGYKNGKDILPEQ